MGNFARIISYIMGCRQTWENLMKWKKHNQIFPSFHIIFSPILFFMARQHLNDFTPDYDHIQH
jgi:hypothetical protein